MKQSLQIPNELRSPTSIKKTRVFAKGLGPFHWHLTVTLDSPINLAEFFWGEKLLDPDPSSNTSIVINIVMWFCGVKRP